MLAQADLHITSASSSVYESSSVGVPTIFTSKVALEYFEGFISSGQAHFAESSDQLVKLVSSIDSFKTQDLSEWK